LDSYWLFLTVVFLVAVTFFLLIRLRVRGVTRVIDGDLSWVENFSVVKYRPMQRLLNEEDVAFLEDADCNPQSIKVFRKERRRVFRIYLKSLRKDFDRLYAIGKLAALHSEPQGVNLAGALARSRAIFYYALTLVEIRLVLHSLGVGTVDVRALIGALDGITTDVRALRPIRAAA
jgi:hypothetical protein